MVTEGEDTDGNRKLGVDFMEQGEHYKMMMEMD